MSDAYSTAYAGMDSRVKMIEIVTNNLANSQTTGFKADFARLMEAEQSVEVSNYMDMAPGVMSPTGNDLDVAIDGEGFFQIQTPSGVRYTRDGSFKLSESGDLVTQDGMKVLSASGSPINVSGAKVSVQDGGVVSGDGIEVATLKVVTFRNNNLLQREGKNRMVWTGSADGIQDVDQPRVMGGALEHSNVNATLEIIRLMSAYREFESVQKSVKTMDADINGKLIQELGRLS